MPQTGRISNGVKGKIKEKNASIFGDWLMVIGQSHPQAALEAATRRRRNRVSSIEHPVSTPAIRYTLFLPRHSTEIQSNLQRVTNKNPNS